MRSDRTRRFRFGLPLAAAALVSSLVVVAAPSSAAPPGNGAGPEAKATIDVLSSRAEYVSGGDARVAVEIDKNVQLSRVHIYAGDADVTDSFELDAVSRTFEGVLDGLPEGTTELRAVRQAGRSMKELAALEVTNHPVQGPMFSGPHQQPFYCQTEAAGLGPALDADCFAPTKVELMYRSTSSGGFQPLPDGPLPADLAQTTSTNGATVDYIVRLETGVINRAVYQTAVLYDPDVADTDSSTATPGWNRRLVYSYGGGCNVGHRQGAGNGGVLSHLHLSQGYATASSSLNVLDNNCNDVTSAETTSMVKERFIETYGVDDYTIGWGGSGGAISQHMIGDNFPGLLDGIIPTLSYPDYGSNSGVADCRAIGLYVGVFGTGTGLTTDQITAITGHAGWNNCVAWWFAFSNRIVADEGCPGIIPVAERWSLTNPTGIRCTISDHIVNLVGTDPATGYAYTSYDNTGMQYGLQALNDGVISVDEFLDFNEGIGGFDHNGHRIAERSVAAEQGLINSYAGGRVVNGGGGLATMPIIDTRPYLDQVTDIHMRFHSFSIRERLEAVNGRSDNQVIQVWDDFGAAQAEALRQMDEWLANIGKEWDERTIEDVVAAKPADVVDGCSIGGVFTAETATWPENTGTCGTAYPTHGDPRTAAGQSAALDVLKCQLQPTDTASYVPSFDSAQWDRLNAIFPDGVCDYTQPGVGQVPLAGTWQRYG